MGRRGKSETIALHLCSFSGSEAKNPHAMKSCRECRDVGIVAESKARLLMT